MARIPDGELQRLKEEVSVQRLVEAAGIDLRSGGKDLLGRCPFHADAEPSLVVTPAKNLWHCFGCGIGGGPIDWVMKKNAVSFRHAVELLRADPSLAAGADAAPVKQSRQRKLAAPVALDAGEQQMLDQVIDFYHQTLLASPEALGYLDKRGIAEREAIERFRLGFANRTLGYRLPAKQVKAGAEMRGRLQKIGLLRESGHEHFNGCLVIPIFDEAGHVTEVYGRKITEGVNPPLHLYLPDPHRGVWNVQGLVGQHEVILCEALIDALTFWCAGYHNVTAAYGVEGFTDDHIAAFQRHGIGRVLIAFDRDEAGDRGAVKVAERLIAAGFECYRVLFPKGMDANEYALKMTPAAKSLGVLVRQAVWIGKGPAPAEKPGLHAENLLDDTQSVAATPAVATPSLAAKEEPASVASAPAPTPTADIAADVRDDEVVLSFGDRRYRVRGLAKNLGVETLKVNVLASCAEAYYVDTFDLYHARQRTQFIAQAAAELAIREDVVKLDLGKVLLKLEALQAERLRQTLRVDPALPAMSEAEHDEALALLRDPQLLDRIVADFDACGLVGETTNKLVGYLAAASRKLDAPLAILVQSSTAAGKSSLMDAVLAFMPEEEKVKYSAMTGQSLFYMGETNLKHKILAICEEEGASRAAYALKLLQSDGELTIASTGKDPDTGNLITQQYRVEGPVMIFLTTTAIEIDEELLNRCLVLSVDEGRAQTEAIHALQRRKRTLEGLRAKQMRARLLRMHQNAQRLLRPLAVMNPFADQLTFLSDKTRTRRDHEKYLTLIDVIALLHQHQRPVQTMLDAGQAVEYVEATVDDIACANAIAHDVLGRSLDELPPQTRRLLAAIVEHVRTQMQAQCLAQSAMRFTRKQVRELVGWGDTQTRVHLERLVALEYLLTHRDGSGGRFVYELLFDGDVAAAVHLSGLIDVAALQSVTTTAKSRGQHAQVAGRLRAGCGPVAGGSRADVSAEEQALAPLGEESPGANAKTHVARVNGTQRSYVHPPSSLAAAEVAP
ncbi:MAG TPA: DNA primase [Burkholderiaceae bacterium]|nr:DNA primase [Burkholderiaceae bacterium]